MLMVVLLYSVPQEEGVVFPDPTKVTPTSQISKDL